MVLEQNQHVIMCHSIPFMIQKSKFNAAGPAAGGSALQFESHPPQEPTHRECCSAYKVTPYL